jgi:hypothetical protein
MDSSSLGLTCKREEAGAPLARRANERTCRTFRVAQKKKINSSSYLAEY